MVLGGGTLFVLFVGLHNEAGGQGEIRSVRRCDAEWSEQGVPVALLLRATRLTSSIEFESSFVINTFELDAIVRSSVRLTFADGQSDDEIFSDITV